MSTYSFTGNKVSFTYQRLLQISDGGDGNPTGIIYDGYGATVTIADENINNLYTTVNNLIANGIPGSTGPQGATGPIVGLQRVLEAGNTFSTSIIGVSGSNISNLDYITFSTTAVYTNQAGKIGWNDQDGTLNIGLKGGNVTLQVGQEQLQRVVNKTGADLLESEYKAVRIRRKDEGGTQGQRLAVVLAQGNNDANSVDTLGLVTENITDNQEGFITTSGLVRDIDTTGTLQGETWSDGDALYLSPFVLGQLTKVKPQAPSHTVVMGYVVYAHQNQGKIFVKVDNGYEIDELHNVRIVGTPSNGQALLYNSSSNVWEAGTVSLTSGSGTTGPQGSQGLTGPQGIAGPTGAQGLIGSTGAGGALGYYGVFIDTTTQTNVNPINVMQFNTTVESNGITIGGPTNSQITFANAGTYNIQFSAQIDKTDGGVDQIDIWFAKNGNPIPYSNSILESDVANFEIIASWNYVATVNAGDYYEIFWYSADSAMRLLSVGTQSGPPVRPAVPSTILTVTQVMYTQVGATGSQGVTGPQGLTGPQGIIGDNGISGGLNLFFNSSVASDVVPYRQLSKLTSTASQTIVPVSLAGNQQNVLVDSGWITDFDYPGVLVIPNGIWHMYGYFTKVSQTANIEYYYTVSKWDGISAQILFTSSQVALGWDTNNTTPVEVKANAIATTAIISLSDRLIVNVYLNNNDPNPRTANFYTEGANNYSYIVTTLEVKGITGPQGSQGPTGSQGLTGPQGPIPDLSGYVPYVGATADVNLGVYDLFADRIKAGLSSLSPQRTLHLGGNIYFDRITPPTGASLSLMTYSESSGSGNIDIGTYRYDVGYYSFEGDTEPSFSPSIITANVTSNSSSVTLYNLPISPDQRVSGRKIYRTTNAGSYLVTYQVGTVSDNTSTTFIDTLSDADVLNQSLGYRKANTTAGVFYFGNSKAFQLSDYNLSIGVNALQSNSSGDSTVAVGAESLRSNLTGDNNVAVGYSPLLYNTSGNDNIAIGYAAVYDNKIGNQNIGIGSNALRNAVSSGGGTASYSDNIAIGYFASGLIDGMQYNVAIGTKTGARWNGDYNVFLGGRSADRYSQATASGSGNIFIGYATGLDTTSLTTNNYNILLGYDLNLPNLTGNRLLNIGNLIFATGLGITDTLGVGGVSIGTSSFAGYKLDVAGTTRISGSNSSAMLLINQVGTGNAITIEDDTNPDATPFVVDSTGRVGIGTTGPTSNLDVFGQQRITGQGSTYSLIVTSTGNSFITMFGNGVSSGNGYFRITNATSTSGIFAATFWSRSNTTAYPSAWYLADLLSSVDSGTVAAMRFEARFDENQLISVRPLFEWRNSTTRNMLMFADGSLMLQNGGTFTGVTSSILTLNSTTKGFLPPRVTSVEKYNISSPVSGLFVYDTDLTSYSYFNGVTWSTVGTGAGSGSTGPQGATGPQGLQGPTGIQGSTGVQGETGPQGVQGLQGSTGMQGETGPQGVQGLQGITGSQGETGPQGIQGSTGMQGETGPQGLKGDNGPNVFAGVLYTTNTWSNPGNGSIVLPNVVVALYDNPNFSGLISTYSVTGGTYTLVNEDTNFIYIDYNSGNPIYGVDQSGNTINDSNIVRVMTVYRLNNFIHTLDYAYQGSGLPNKINNRIIAVERFARESGLIIGLSGSSGIVELSSGVAWNGTNRQSLAYLNSFDDIFFKNYHVSGSWTVSTSSDYLNNTYYDNGTDIVSASASKYLVNWYFRGQEINDHLYEVYGTDQYDSVSEAQISIEPNLPELVTSHAFLVGRVIVQVGTYSGLAETSFTTTFQATNVQAHNDLTNIQGGSPGEYYHLSSNQYNNVVIADGSQSVGDSIVWNGFNWESTTSVGVTGPQGFTGPQGLVGTTGFQGETGPQGLQGSTGMQGETGPQGLIGSTGSQGSTGPQGFTGPQGLLGSTGVQGNTGPQGLTGPQGSQGSNFPFFFAAAAPSIAGLTAGSRWFDSSTGVEFVLIDDGSSIQWVEPISSGGGGGGGVAGPQGNQGVTGPQGLGGGSTGPQGVTGPQGAAGSGSSNSTSIVSGLDPDVISGMTSSSAYVIDGTPYDGYRINATVNVPGGNNVYISYIGTVTITGATFTPYLTRGIVVADDPGGFNRVQSSLTTGALVYDETLGFAAPVDLMTVNYDNTTSATNYDIFFIGGNTNNFSCNVFVDYEFYVTKADVISFSN